MERERREGGKMEEGVMGRRVYVWKREWRGRKDMEEKDETGMREVKEEGREERRMKDVKELEMKVKK